MKLLLTLLLLIPSLSWGDFSKSSEGTTQLSREEFREYQTKIDIKVADKGVYEGTPYIILEEINNLNLKV